MLIETCALLAVLSADQKPVITSGSTTVKVGERTRPEVPPPPEQPLEREPEVGGVTSPAALPSGAIAFYGLLGAPDVGAGYRQGFPFFELEGRALFNYLELSGLIEGGIKFAVVKTDRLMIAPGFALGLKLDSGSRYFDRVNFAYVGLRPRVSVTTSLKLTDTLVGLALLEVPWAAALAAPGVQVTPLLGAGAELHLGGKFSVLGTAHLGFDAIKEPLGVVQYRPAWALRLGVGYRLF